MELDHYQREESFLQRVLAEITNNQDTVREAFHLIRQYNQFSRGFNLLQRVNHWLSTEGSNLTRQIRDHVRNMASEYSRQINEHSQREYDANYRDNVRRLERRDPKRQRMNHDHDPEEPILGDSIEGHGPMIGNANIQKAGETIIQNNPIMNGKTKLITLTSSVQFSHGISTPFDGTVACVPWRCPKAVIGTDKLLTATAMSSMWRPISAHVELDNLEAYTDIKSGQNLNPVQLSNIMVRAVKSDSLFVSSRIAAFDNTEDYDEWLTLMDQQNTMEQVGDLPKTKLFMDYDIYSAPVMSANSDFWAEKPLNFDANFKWNWYHKDSDKHYWRSHVELLHPIKVQRGDNTKYSYFPNYDYMWGGIQRPVMSNFNGSAKGEAFPYSGLVSHSFVLPPNFISEVFVSTLDNGDIVKLGDTSNNDVSDFQADYGRDTTFVDTSKLFQEYSEPNNIMPEIYIDFTRKNTGVALQPFHVHGRLRFTYVIEVMENRVTNQGYNPSVNPTLLDTRVLPGIVNRIGGFITSGTSIQDGNNDAADQTYRKNRYFEWFCPVFQAVWPRQK